MTVRDSIARAMAANTQLRAASAASLGVTAHGWGDHGAAGYLMPGDAGWEVAGTWTYSSPVAQVDFTDLGDYADLLIELRLVSASGSQNRQIRLSVDNGSSFYATSGDYKAVAATGVESDLNAAPGLSAASVDPRTCTFWIPGSNLTGAEKRIYTMSTVVPKIFAASTSPIDAIRVIAGADNLTGGTITVKGRKA